LKFLFSLLFLLLANTESQGAVCDRNGENSWTSQQTMLNSYREMNDVKVAIKNQDIIFDGRRWQKRVAVAAFSGENDVTRNLRISHLFRVETNQGPDEVLVFVSSPGFAFHRISVGGKIFDLSGGLYTNIIFNLTHTGQIKWLRSFDGAGGSFSCVKVISSHFSPKHVFVGDFSGTSLHGITAFSTDDGAIRWHLGSMSDEAYSPRNIISFDTFGDNLLVIWSRNQEQVKVRVIDQKTGVQSG